MQKTLIRLSDEILPNTGIKEWVNDYGSEKRRDYGLEFLTEATHGDTQIPDTGKYLLPDSVAPVHIEDTIEEKVMQNPDIPGYKKKGIIAGRLHGIKKKWEKGSKPYSIIGLDVLRESNFPYNVDLLKPFSYDRSVSETDGILYSSKFVQALAYLSASVISGGCIDQQGTACIETPRNLGVEKLFEKLMGAATPDKENQSSSFVLKRPYSRILQLTGLSRGRLVNARQNQLGLDYINTLNDWIEKVPFSAPDTEHAIQVLSRFVEGVIDHRATESNSGTVTIRLPRFSEEDTAEYFSDLFVRSFKKTFSGVEFNAAAKKDVQEYGGEEKIYYHTLIFIPKKHVLRINTLNTADRILQLV
ncbi:hypothetical protein KY317_02040 [Candidatus Woesearchaeota archaeon]|nr:hypothetical protein [Candidatus Woesearchaeota archaeon]